MQKASPDSLGVMTNPTLHNRKQTGYMHFRKAMLNVHTINMVASTKNMILQTG